METIITFLVEVVVGRVPVDIVIENPGNGGNSKLVPFNIYYIQEENKKISHWVVVVMKR